MAMNLGASNSSAMTMPFFAKDFSAKKSRRYHEPMPAATYI
jgi:hypothetical protein